MSKTRILMLTLAIVLVMPQIAAARDCEGMLWIRKASGPSFFEVEGGRIVRIVLNGEDVLDEQLTRLTRWGRELHWNRASRDAMVSSFAAYADFCEGTLETQPADADCNREGTECTCKNEGPALEWLLCADSLISDCEELGCSWSQDPGSGDVTCTCPDNN